MRHRLFGLAGLLAIAAGPAPFVVGGIPIPQSDIVDARALPKVSGGATLQITIEGASARRLASLPAAPAKVELGGKPLCPPIAREAVASDTILLDCFGAATADQVAAIAKRISGKDPLPDSLDDSF